jgi:oxalate decarboxylase/phosphoglucose isomerase-like protein (cupin superfamily)
MSKLDLVKYDVDFVKVNSDGRRIIYDPARITWGFEGQWHSHSIITPIHERAELGNHFHDYDEVFFTPNGCFDFKLVDIESFETRKYILNKGNRILIPQKVGHVAIGTGNGVLMGYGNAPYDSKRIFPLSTMALEALSLVK